MNSSLTRRINSSICSLAGYGLVARSRRHIIYSLIFKVCVLTAGEKAPIARSLTIMMIVFFHIQDEEEAALFTSQKGVITTLTKGCKSVEVVRDISKIPSGCGSTVLTSTISLHILVRVSFFSSGLVTD